MIKTSLMTLVSWFCLAAHLQAAPILIDWKKNGGVDAVYAGGASIQFAPIQVQSFDSLSISGYWTNLVDTRFSNLQADIRVRIGGNWRTVAFNDNVRGSYGSSINFVSTDFIITPNDLSSTPIDGLMIAPNSVIYSGLGGLNSGSGTIFSFAAITVSEPQSVALVLLSLSLLGIASRRRGQVAILN